MTDLLMAIAVVALALAGAYGAWYALQLAERALEESDDVGQD